MSTARALEELSAHWDAVAAAMRRSEASREKSRLSEVSAANGSPAGADVLLPTPDTGARPVRRR